MEVTRDVDGVSGKSEGEEEDFESPPEKKVARALRSPRVIINWREVSQIRSSSRA